MLGWSINLFRVRGILLSVHFSFLLLLGWVAWDGWQTAETTGLLWMVAVFLSIFTCVVLHELGHSLTAGKYGIGVRRILLMPIGGMAEFERIPRQPKQELIITLAGPAVNFVIAGILVFFVDLPRGWTSGEVSIEMNAHGIFEFLLMWNISMGLFNLLPSFPMDGGRILRALLATRISYLKATFWAATVGKVVCAAGIVYAVYHVLPLLGLLFGFIFVVGEAEYRAEKRRVVEEEYWRQMVARSAVFSDQPASASGRPTTNENGGA